MQSVNSTLSTLISYLHLENTSSSTAEIKQDGKDYEFNGNCQKFHEFLKPEEIVMKIIQKEKDDTVNEDCGGFTSTKLDDLHWEKKETEYLKIEKWIRENDDKIPTYDVAGPLNYGMSINEMKDVITQKFKNMVSSGNLMTQKSLDINHDRTNFYPLIGKCSYNLTRIWGAEFLKSNLLEQTLLSSAEHFLVVKDPSTEIEVQVWHGEYPYLSVVKNAYVLSTKIEGERKAENYRFSSKLNELRYRDFGDPGNIIQDTNGKGWIVDTEIKSFDLPKLNRNDYLIRNYLGKRFEVLSGENYDDLYQTFKISVSDIGLI